MRLTIPREYINRTIVENIFKEAYEKGIADAGVRLAEMDEVIGMDEEKALSRLDGLIERDGEDNLNWQNEKAFYLGEHYMENKEHETACDPGRNITSCEKRHTEGMSYAYSEVTVSLS